MSDECIFCRIASGEQPAERLHEDDEVIAFRDVNPQAPVHALVIPREHIASLAAVHDAHTHVLGRLQVVVAALARQLGIAEGGYRTVINCGGDGGQTVHHLHLHLLGGHAMGWPPWPRS